jgi:hypothetical protein
MLVWGISNPEGVDTDQSIYVTCNDMGDLIGQIESASKDGKHIPVKLEHKGVNVGKVVSAWIHNGEMQCVLDINERTLEGSFGCEFIREGIVKDLSLGYEVNMQQSKHNKVRVTRKIIKEISIVKKGARRKCHILGVCK